MLFADKPSEQIQNLLEVVVQLRNKLLPNAIAHFQMQPQVYVYTTTCLCHVRQKLKVHPQLKALFDKGEIYATATLLPDANYLPCMDNLRPEENV